jgi:[acyl-carrier-protein] S-malonyltransferase
MAKPVALLFPGQGAQVLGMGLPLAEAFPVVAEWYEQAEDACKLPLRDILANGPAETLRLTEILQPTLLTVEIGAWLALNELVKPKVVVALGHSLGEYAALVAAGALDAAEAVLLVRKRGAYMQAAVPNGVGGMMAVMGLRTEHVERACDEFSGEGAKVWLSNDNCPGQVVISGHVAALKKVAVLLKELGASRMVVLEVSAPFHCPLMIDAGEALAEELAEIEIGTPTFPVLANYNSQPYETPDGIRVGLERQVEAPVRFRQSLLAVQRYKPAFALDLGPRPVAAGLAKRTIREVPLLVTDTLERLEQAAKEIG